VTCRQTRKKKQGAAGRRARRALAAFKRANNPCFGSPLIAQLVPGQGLSMPNKDIGVLCFYRLRRPRRATQKEGSRRRAKIHVVVALCVCMRKKGGPPRLEVSVTHMLPAPRPVLHNSRNKRVRICSPSFTATVTSPALKARHYRPPVTPVRHHLSALHFSLLALLPCTALVGSLSSHGHERSSPLKLRTARRA
jgi:hypothetical protein